MNNIMIINGQKAVIAYDPEIEMFRGEFIGLSGGADFYAADVASLKAEGETSLRVYLDMCAEKGIEPYKSYSGKFNVRIAPNVHSAAVISAAAQGKSLNEWVADAIEEHAEHTAEKIGLPTPYSLLFTKNEPATHIFSNRFFIGGSAGALAVKNLISAAEAVAKFTHPKGDASQAGNKAGACNHLVLATGKIPQP